MKFNRRIREAIMAAGFSLHLWPLGQMLGEDNYTFKRGTMHGLLGCDDRILTIIAIANEEPGNGQFAAAMNDLERIAARRQLTVEVAAIFNAGLARHLVEKRGYEPHAKAAGHLILKPVNPAARSA